MGDRPWSQDSRTLLVARSSDSGQTAVYRIDRESGDAEQFTFPPVGSSDLSASHSFDGRRIVFQRRTHGKGALLTMPADGGKMAKVVSWYDNEWGYSMRTVDLIKLVTT